MTELHTTALAALVLVACVLWCIWQGPRDE